MLPPTHPVLLASECLSRTLWHPRVAQASSLSPAALGTASLPPPCSADGGPRAETPPHARQDAGGHSSHPLCHPTRRWRFCWAPAQQMKGSEEG